MNERVDVEVMAWLGRIRALDEGSLERLIPLLDATDALGSLRVLLGMLPALAGDAGELLALPRDVCIAEVFRLRTVAAFLGGDTAIALTLDAWCREQLVGRARREPDFADRLKTWCVSTVAEFGERPDREAIAGLLRCIRSSRCRRSDE